MAGEGGVEARQAEDGGDEPWVQGAEPPADPPHPAVLGTAHTDHPHPVGGGIGLHHHDQAGEEIAAAQADLAVGQHGQIDDRHGGADAASPEPADSAASMDLHDDADVSERAPGSRPSFPGRARSARGDAGLPTVVTHEPSGIDPP
jgi:hypothetical protein